MNLNLNTIGTLSGGGGFDTGYTAILDRAGVRTFDIPTEAQLVKQNALYKVIKQLPLDWFYVSLNNIGLNFGRLNWVNPATFELTGSPTWTSNQGVKSVSSSYFDTGWAFSDGIAFEKDSGSAFGWVFTEGNDAKAVMGAILSGPDRTIGLSTRDASNRVTQYAINAGAANAGANNSMPSDLGLHLSNRVDSGNQTHYRNNIVTATAATTSITPTDIDVSLLARNFNGTRDSHFVRDVSIFGAGAGLDAGERAALYNACASYVAAPE